MRAINHTNPGRKRNRKGNAKVTRIGYILWESADLVVIATLKTRNGKTGNMVQVWILMRNVNPVEAIATGQDVAICFNCPRRGDIANGIKRDCYVNVGQAPNSIFKAYHAGRYSELAPADYVKVFGNRKVRWGAYGEPVLIPLDIFRGVTAVAKGHTGYTHQWRNPEFQAYREYLMASIDNESEVAEAEKLGWSRFRVKNESDPKLADEISCPASKEMGNKLTCSQCLRCSGRPADKPVRKSIVINIHGSAAKAKAKKLIQILPAA